MKLHIKRQLNGLRQILLSRPTSSDAAAAYHSNGGYINALYNNNLITRQEHERAVKRMDKDFELVFKAKQGR